MSPSGMIPPTITSTSSRPSGAEPVDDARDEGEMGARQQRQSDGVGVLLDHGLDHLLGRLVQPGVDHLEAGVPKGAGDDLGTSVVAIEPGLGHNDPVRTLHRAPSVGTSA